MKWEAKAVYIGGLNNGDINKMLEKECGEGWEPFACDSQRVYFKRLQKQWEPERKPEKGTLAHAFREK